ncbi:hypothetical protein [Pseudomonas piscis]|uniref:hypothetical protein n=1 Tax=Pseudomonas piscis TaxID=2614538 RepID=UPI0021D6128E|nr:hypothetical protein [Pseudomonas piscis]MCU7645605.1 hypothetical protein [Pseudomonas piscis]
MPTETQLEQRVAALQSDLNARDQALDDAATENNERELSRRDWFEEAQRLQAELEKRPSQIAMSLQTKIKGLQAKLAERDALLRDTGTCLKSIVRELKGFHDDNPGKWCGYLDDALGAAAWQRDKVDAVLSASAEPARIVTDRPCRLKGANGRLDLHPAGDRCMWCEGEGFEVEYAQRGGAEPVERDERAEFERAWPEISKAGVAHGWKGVALYAWMHRAAMERKP